MYSPNARAREWQSGKSQLLSNPAQKKKNQSPISLLGKVPIGELKLKCGAENSHVHRSAGRPSILTGQFPSCFFVMSSLHYAERAESTISKPKTHQKQKSKQEEKEKDCVEQRNLIICPWSNCERRKIRKNAHSCYLPFERGFTRSN